MRVEACIPLPHRSSQQQVEAMLRAELSQALERLNRSRAAIENLAEQHPLASNVFREAASERLEALRAVETASTRFADFVLDGVIPGDVGRSKRF